MRRLDDSHIFTAEMQKKIRAAAHVEARPVLIWGTARVRHCLRKPGFDDLSYYVNDVLTSVDALAFGRVSLRVRTPAAHIRTEEHK